jgi:hypothetical protein
MPMRWITRGGATVAANVDAGDPSSSKGFIP